MRYSNMQRSHRFVLVLFFTMLLVGFTVLRTPTETDEPAASPTDKAMEDLSRIEYPSMVGMRWHPHFVKPNETLESLFGSDWVWIARLNRVDRRHVYPGMTIKVPDRMADARSYCPLPAVYEPARQHTKYILVDITEQWLGAYERGRLAFSAPAATGKAGTGLSATTKAKPDQPAAVKAEFGREPGTGTKASQAPHSRATAKNHISRR